MNQTKNISKNMSIEKEKQRTKNINALKDTEYSSIYSLITFWTSTILVFTNAFMKASMIKSLVEFVILCIMVVVCHILTVQARKKCEKEGEKYRSSESGVLVKMATNIGYLNPVVCLIGWAVTLKGVELGLKIFLVIVVAVTAFFAIQTPWSEHLKKNKKKSA
jgi:L-asparagine transporter-like permease